MGEKLKVFGIGFNRTGTSSLKLALKKLGFNVLVRNGQFVKRYSNDRTKWILNNIEEWDAFQDWPWPMLHVDLLDHLGEDARFILTRRATPEKWVESLKKHSERTNPDSHQRRVMLGYDYPHGLEEEHIALYDNHLKRVRLHFKAQGKEHLLKEMCWEEGDGWPELCGFLNEPIPTRSFPRANQSADAERDPDFVTRNIEKIDAQLNRLKVSS